MGPFASATATLWALLLQRQRRCRVKRRCGPFCFSDGRQIRSGTWRFISRDATLSSACNHRARKRKVAINPPPRGKRRSAARGCYMCYGIQFGAWSALQMRDISQCSIAPDYGYKRRSTNREALRMYTQPEGMGHLVRVMFYGRSNFGNF